LELELKLELDLLSGDDGVDAPVVVILRVDVHGDGDGDVRGDVLLRVFRPPELRQQVLELLHAAVRPLSLLLRVEARLRASVQLQLLRQGCVFVQLLQSSIDALLVEHCRDESRRHTLSYVPGNEFQFRLALRQGSLQHAIFLRDLMHLPYHLS
jgi:hypothetical protein